MPVLAQNLRDAVLKAAIQGKLTEQNFNDTSVRKTISAINDDRNSRISKKEIKKDKRLNYKKVVEDKFDIPNSWEWVTLGTVLYKLTDGTHKTPKYTQSGIKFVSVKDMSSGHLSLSNTKFISKEEHEELFARCNPEKGDILLSKVGTTGVPAIIDTDETFSLFVSVALLKFNDLLINRNFLYRLLQSPYVQQQAVENTKGIGNKNWVLDKIADTKIPLPPIEEQQRIVDKLNEIMPLIDEYEKLEHQLVELKKKFPDDMKAAVLQAAMEGKLTTQNFNEDMSPCIKTIKKNNKKFSLPNQDDYDIPDNWIALKFSDIFDIKNGFTPLRSNPEFWESKDIPWFTIEDIHNQGRFITNTEQYISRKALSNKSQRILPKDTVLLCCTASVGEYAYSCIELTTNQQFNGLVRKSFLEKYINPLYVYYFVQTLKGKLIDSSGKTTFNFLSAKKLGQMIFPIPPIEEQQRIVDKLDNLLPLIDKLKGLENDKY